MVEKRSGCFTSEAGNLSPEGQESTFGLTLFVTPQLAPKRWPTWPPNAPHFHPNAAPKRSEEDKDSKEEDKGAEPEATGAAEADDTPRTKEHGGARKRNATPRQPRRPMRALSKARRRAVSASAATAFASSGTAASCRRKMPVALANSLRAERKSPAREASCACKDSRAPSA